MVVAVVVVGGLALTTMCNPNPSCIELELGSGFDNSYLEISFGQKCYSDRFFGPNFFFQSEIFWPKIFLGSKFFLDQMYRKYFFAKNVFLTMKCLWAKKRINEPKKGFWTKKSLLDKKSICTINLYLY